METLLSIAAVSPELSDAAIGSVADGHTSGAQLARDPSWAISQAVRSGRSKAFAAFLDHRQRLRDRRASARQEGPGGA